MHHYVRDLDISNDGIVSLENGRRDLDRPRFETEGGVRHAGLQLQLEQHPDVVGELQGLIEHVLALDVALGYRENVAVRHFGGHGVRVAAHFV